MRLQFATDGSVLVRTGKVELGQGILTALTQIAADELGLRVDQVRVLPADTELGPDEGITSGSLSVQDGGAALRQACIAARAERDGPAGHAQQPNPPVVGTSLPRLDLPAKFAGRPSFIHDLQPEGLLHGRVLHPPQRDARLVAAETDAAAHMPGVLAVHRDGRLFGVLAQTSAQADAAMARLMADVQWRAPQDEAAAVVTAPTAQLASEHGTRPADGIARTLQARYTKPWISHASIAPSCALARWDGDRLQVWSHSQGIFMLRRDLALAFGIDASAVRVQHAEGAGCYGHNGADDVAFDAAWLARLAPGRCVRVLWSRADELARAPQGPAMEMALQADLDASGQVLHWRHHVTSPGHSSRPGRSATPALLGSWQTTAPFSPPPAINMPAATGGGAERNAQPGYAFPGWQVWSQPVPQPPLRPSALRSLGAFGNVFAAESFVDEVAHASGRDVLGWRLQHLAHDPRASAVLRLAVDQSGWANRRIKPDAMGAETSVSNTGPNPALKPDSGANAIGHGIACARYKGTGAWCAVVAEVEAGATLRVRRLTIAVDVGLAINPDGVASQIEGGAIQATSWTLKEAVQFAGQQVSSDSWARYPILRFSEMPAVDVHIVASSQASLGAGEASIGPTAAAIANALFDALGVRVRDLPLTAENIVAAMDAPTS